MSNPLFNSLYGRGNSQAEKAPQMTMRDAMSQLQEDPAGLIKQAGFNVPGEIAGNPQAAVMHLIRTGQVGGPMMQRIAPMMRMLGVR